MRGGDAVHLATALEIGEREVWTGDRHMLAAAPHFGLIGRTA
jgi:predicted nucleic acid-binding protein